MEPEVERLLVEPADDEGIANVADLYIANLDVRDERVLQQAYHQIIASVPESYRELYAEAAGLVPPKI